MRDLVRNISWLGATNVAVKPLWFLFVTAFCMRILGVEGYGVFSAAIALSMMATAFTDFGMARYSTREIARDHSQGALFFSNLYALRLGAVVAAAGIAFAAAVALGYRGDALTAVLFACGYTTALQLTQYCRAIFEAFERLKVEAAMLVLEKVLVLGGGVIALFATRTPHWTLAGMAAGMALTTVVNTIWIGRNLTPFRLRLIDRRFIVRSVRTMLPLGLAGLFIALYYRVDLVMVEAMLGEAAAGQYGVAYRILEALNMITAVVVIAALFPRLSRLREERKSAEFSTVFSRGQIGLSVISLAVAASITVLAPWIIGLLTSDPAFGPSVAALRILVWAFPLLCANSLLYSALLAMEDDRFTAWLVGAAVLLNVGLNWYMIPAFGINGAAIATIIPEAVLIFVYAIRYRRIRAQESAPR